MEIKAYGDTVKINQIGAITVSDYTKNTDISDPQELSTTEKVLTIDKQKYFNFQIDDVDAAQVRTPLMDAAMQRAAYALAEETEKVLLQAIDTDATHKIAATFLPLFSTKFILFYPLFKIVHD